MSEDQLAQTLTELAQAGQFVGLSLAVVHQDVLTYAAGFGRTTVQPQGVAVQADTLFPYRSVSKNLCAALVMRLVAAGLLDLDRPVQQYDPQLRFHNPEYGARITLRHILSHTTGLPMAGRSYGPAGRDALARFAHLEIPDYRSLAPPGQFHLYSNSVFCLAGHLAEQVTGRYFTELMSEWVFDPLQMVHSTYKPHVAMTYPLALPHRLNRSGQFELQHSLPYNDSGIPSSFCYGTALDLANLARMYLAGGRFAGQQILPAELIAEMQRPHISRYIDGASHLFTNYYQGYGLGFQLGAYRGLRVVRHPGGGGGYNIYFDLLPELNQAIIIMLNDGGHPGAVAAFQAIYEHFAGAHFAAPLFASPRPITIDDSAQWSCLTGHFVAPDTGRLLEITTSESGLVMISKGQTYPLRPIGRRHYDFELVVAEQQMTHRLTVKFAGKDDEPADYLLLSGDPLV
ncbi:MAG: beta-lactamase family protein, partial [Anaerolineales bacterium]|nr:beta-lactamase family protein [Anaerolineales bacterium]